MSRLSWLLFAGALALALLLGVPPAAVVFVGVMGVFFVLVFEGPGRNWR